MIKILPNATNYDVLICNIIVTPTKGCSIDDGTGVIIPDDWLNKIMEGKDVPGCTYYKIESDGSLFVDYYIQNQLTDADVIQLLPINLQTRASLMLENLVPISTVVEPLV